MAKENRTINEPVWIEFEVTDEQKEELDELARRSQTELGEILKQAIALYLLAQPAIGA